VRLDQLPDDILTPDALSNLQKMGLGECRDVAITPTAQLEAARCKKPDNLRAACTLGMVQSIDDPALLERLLAQCPDGAVGLVKADTKALADALNADVTDISERIDTNRVLDMQQDAAVTMVRLVLQQLTARGWINQLASFEPPSDPVVQYGLDVLRVCGTFAAAKPYLDAIDNLFNGFGGLAGAGAAVKQTISQIKAQPDEMEARRQQLAQHLAVGHSGWPSGVGLGTILGITEAAVAALQSAGITDVYRLRTRDSASIAKATALNVDDVERWRRQADLQARPGVSPSTAFTCVSFDATSGGDPVVYRHLLALGQNSTPDLSHHMVSSLYAYGDQLLAQGKVPEDPFPYRSSLAQTQETLMALSNLLAGMGLRNALIAADGDAALVLAEAVNYQWYSDQSSLQRMYTPSSPFLISITPPGPLTSDSAQFAAQGNAADVAIGLAIKSSQSSAAFPAGLAVAVVRLDDFSLDQRSQYAPDAGRKDSTGVFHAWPSLWARVDRPEELWAQVTTSFQLREFLSADELSPLLRSAARLEDAQRDSTGWAALIAKFPIHFPLALLQTAAKAQHIRDDQGVPVTVFSSYRTPGNSVSRGASRHMWGTAIDVTQIGATPMDFTQRDQTGGLTPVAYYGRQYLVPAYANWDGEQQLPSDVFPLPTPAVMDETRWSYAEDHQTIISTQVGDHLHLDWGYPTPDQEIQLLQQYAGHGAGSAIEIRIPEYDEANDWQAGNASERLVAGLNKHLAGAVGPGTIANADVTAPQTIVDPVLGGLIKLGIPSAWVRIGDGVKATLDQRQDVMREFARALIAALLGMDDRGIGLVSGTVKWVMQSKDTPQPLPDCRVGLTLGPSTDVDTDSVFGGQLGTEYQLYNETTTAADGSYQLYLVYANQQGDPGGTDVRIYAEHIGYGRRVVEYQPTSKPDQHAPDIVLTRVQLSAVPGGCPLAALACAVVVALFGFFVLTS